MYLLKRNWKRCIHTTILVIIVTQKELIVGTWNFQELLLDYKKKKKTFLVIDLKPLILCPQDWLLYALVRASTCPISLFSLCFTSKSNSLKRVVHWVCRTGYVRSVGWLIVSYLSVSILDNQWRLWISYHIDKVTFDLRTILLP